MSTWIANNGTIPAVTTNYDRIISKTPEEMAVFLFNRDIDIVEKISEADGFTFTVDREKCLKNMLDWLKQEATVEK